MILHYGNKAYAENPYTGPNTPEMLEAFGRYVAFMVTTFKDRVYAWEIWNEPDHSHIWQPASNSKEYSQLVNYVAPIIRKIDPGALIVAGALSGPKWEYLHSLRDSGALRAVDVVSFHWYTHPKAPDDLTAETNFNQVRSFVAAIKGLGKRAWITEMGYPTSTDGYGVTETQQATYLQKQIELAAQMGVERCFIYDLIDDGPDNKMGDRFGLFRLDDSAKPAVKVINQINSGLTSTK